MTLVLDAGALIELERDGRAMWVRLKRGWERDEIAVTNAAVFGQVWRGGSRQARLSQARLYLDIRAVDEQLGRAAGELLGATGKSDIVDATLVLTAQDGDYIVTLDLDDLQPLSAASGRHVELIRP